MKKKPISPEDKNLFREAVKGAKRIFTDKLRHKQKPQPVKIRKPEPEQFESEFDTLSDHESESYISGSEIMSYSKPGLSKRQWRKLQQGKLSIEAKLDLHSMTIDEARIELQEFLLQGQQHELRYVLLIHGKGRSLSGKAILKNKVNNWLRQWPAVLAFHSAKPQHGGTGAAYVLLSRAAGLQDTNLA